MIELVAFGVIVDDLVFSDGHTAMGVLGGGGPQTVLGMRLPALAGRTTGAGRVGLVAGVGPDLPPEAWEWFGSAGIDLSGVRKSELPTARAWQLLEADGRRTQVFRVPGEVIGAQLRRSADTIPEAFRGARGFHLGIHPDEPDLAFINELRRIRPEPPIISVEPFKPADSPPSDTALRSLCSAVNIFSPNVLEAQSLVGDAEPSELARRLADAGARIVTLRMGQEGSLVYLAGGPAVVHVPALLVEVIDPTGAGNAYCGGFLAGYIQTGDVREAARWGTVAGSFLVEQVGLPAVDDRLRAEAIRRFERIKTE